MYEYTAQVKIKDVERLRAAPERLRSLADWFDYTDPQRGSYGSEVQDDLRAWANTIDHILAGYHRDSHTGAHATPLIDTSTSSDIIPEHTKIDNPPNSTGPSE